MRHSICPNHEFHCERTGLRFLWCFWVELSNKQLGIQTEAQQWHQNVDFWGETSHLVHGSFMRLELMAQDRGKVR